MHPPGRYLQNYIRNLFAGAWESRDVSPLPVQVPLATEDEVGFAGDWDGFGGWLGQVWGKAELGFGVKTAGFGVQLSWFWG